MSGVRTKGDVGVRWVWLSLIPFGLGAWAPAYAGARVKNRNWVVQGIVWSAIVLAGWVAAIVSHGGAASGLLIIVGWAGGIASSFVIRDHYRRLVGTPFEAAVIGAEERLSERDRAKRMARERPALARELGVGRPDLPNAQDAGLVDINNAPATVIERLPGVDDLLATQIIEARSATGGFSSVEDLGAALNLDGDLVERLRDRVVFLPR